MSVKIDQINAKILKELLKDGRKSFKEISKECNSSKDVIEKRYKQMKKKRIIVGSTIQNSSACYGCEMVAGMYIFTEPHKDGQVRELVLRLPHILDVYRVGLNPSLSAIVVMKNIQELDSVKQAIKELPFVLGVDARVWTGIRNNPHNLSVLNFENSNDKSVTDAKREAEKAPTKIDELDAQIIEKLAANARMPFKDIARQLKVSTDTIIRRYEKLKRNGHLKVVIQIDPRKIGYNALAMFNLTFSQESLDNYTETLSRIPDVNFVNKNSGEFDYMLSLMVKDIQQLTAVQQYIGSISGVTNMKMSVSKCFSAWPLPREFISSF